MDQTEHGERRHDRDRGASLVEYALLVALIAVVCIGAVTVLGRNSSNKMSSAGTAVAGADAGADPWAGWTCVEEGGAHQFQRIGNPPSAVFPGPCP